MEHDCPRNPMPEAEAAFSEERKRVNAATDRWFPLSVAIIWGKDGRWYLILADEHAVPIESCPFCGQQLAER